MTTKAKTPPTAPPITRLVVSAAGTVTARLCDRSEVTAVLLVTHTLTIVNMNDVELVSLAEVVISTVIRGCEDA